MLLYIMEKHYQKYLLFKKCLEVVEKYGTRGFKYDLEKEVIRVFNDARFIGSGASAVLAKSLQQQLIIKNILLPSTAKKFAKEVVGIIYTPIKLEKPGKLNVKKEKDGVVFTYKKFRQKLGDCHYNQWKEHSNDETIASILMEFSNLVLIVNGMIEAYPTEFMKEFFQKIKKEAKKYYELVLLASFNIAKIDKDIRINSAEPALQKGFGATHSINDFKYDDNCVVLINLYVSMPILYAILDKILLENNHKNLTIVIYRYVKHSGEIMHKSEFQDISTYTETHAVLKNAVCKDISLHGTNEHLFVITNNPKIAKITLSA